MLALLDDGSPLGELAVAARTGSPSNLSADDEPMVERVRALAELSHVLDEGGIQTPAAPTAPAVSINRWHPDSAALASWALGQVERRYLNEGPGILDEIEDVLGVDVLCEPFNDGPLGMSAHLGDIRIIVLNSCQDRRVSHFTLSHELGHILGPAHAPLCVTRDFTGTDPQERFANAFAAQLLAPDDDLRARFPDQGSITPDNLVRAWSTASADEDVGAFELGGKFQIGAGVRVGADAPSVSAELLRKLAGDGLCPPFPGRTARPSSRTAA